MFKEALKKLIPFMVRQAHHERNQLLAVRPELVEGLNQRFPKYPDTVIMVFCKAPVPGQVKTRLMPYLSADEAALLHRELTESTLTKATQNPLCEVQLWCAPAINHSFFAEMAAKYNLSLYTQEGDDLGQRMHHAFCHALGRFKKAILIGCDCPSFGTNDFESAASQLAEGKQCVIGPAEDGGYVLIGLNQPQSELFMDMPWGTEKVLALTCAKLKSLCLDFSILAVQWDVDTVADLERYRQLNQAQ